MSQEHLLGRDGTKLGTAMAREQDTMSTGQIVIGVCTAILGLTILAVAAAVLICATAR